MTLIVGLVCADGVVMAADSGVSLAGLPPLSLPTADKMWTVGGVVVGVAGSGSAAQHVAIALGERPLAVDSIAAFRQDVRARLAQGVPKSVQGSDVLMAGVIEGQPRLLQFTDGEDLEHPGAAGPRTGAPFAAIGQWTRSLALYELGAHFRRARPGTLAAHLLLAYHVLEMAVWMAPELRRPVVVWTVTGAGIRRLDAAALQQLDVGTARWRAKIQEAWHAIAQEHDPFRRDERGGAHGPALQVDSAGQGRHDQPGGRGDLDGQLAGAVPAVP